MNSTSPVGPLARSTSDSPSLHDAGLLLLRAILGAVFLVHGFSKLGDLAGTQQYFDSLGIPAANIMAPIATFTEITGGALLIVGLLTPLACVALAFTMGVALVTQHLESGFFARDGGYEFVLVLGVACLAVAATGPGRLSLDFALSLRERTMARLRLASPAAPMTDRGDAARSAPTA